MQSSKTVNMGLIGDVPGEMYDLVRFQGEPFSREIQEMIEEESWRAAKTQVWPHEYLVRDKVKNEKLFMKFVHHLNDHGYIGRWYSKKRKYYFFQGKIYWVMYDGWWDKSWKDTVDAVSIINRVDFRLCYDYRVIHGRLPKWGR